MIKLSDYVVKFLVRRGIKDVFMVSGGGIMHLVESAGSNRNIRYFCNYNEQATTYCCEGYARAGKGVSACIVTTGPGSTNAVSGVAGAWVDSVPMLVISGQIKRELIADYKKLRQIGEQEINIIDIVKPVTKYAVTVDDPRNIKFELEKAYYIAASGRPGPVWVNIPLDVQGAMIDERKLRSYVPEKPRKNKQLKRLVARIVGTLKAAKRPVLLCGHGIKLSGARELILRIIEKNVIPVLLSFNGMDLVPDIHPMFMGKPGIIGQRRANFVLQNADCVLCIGTRLNMKIVGYNYKDVMKNAKKIVVDIDRNELEKSTIKPDMRVKADAREFLEEFLRQTKMNRITAPRKWIEACKKWKTRYPNMTSDYFKDKKHVNTYAFYDVLSDVLKKNDVVVSANALAALCLYQAFRVKKGQAAFTNNGYGAMGWGLPAAIGACVARKARRVVCVEGDGSLCMNIQELGMLKQYRLPVKVFVFNNSGYTSIRLTQDNFFNGHYVGSDEHSGVNNPDYRAIADAYGLRYLLIRTNNELKKAIKKAVSLKGPALCEVRVSPKQGISPKTMAYRKKDGSFESRPLEDMYPFLSRKELKENMQVSEETYEKKQ
ncbi:MAG: thiamine pyrophosphate-binding protein [Endomicrobiales bacterium]|nr:thiamine pyrophosphate-binding protein [Endomicrobiales bacterium]